MAPNPPDQLDIVPLPVDQDGFPLLPSWPSTPRGQPLPKSFPALWPSKARRPEDPAPAEPELRNGEIRRGELQTTDMAEHLREVARLEFIENAVDVWSGLIGRFERQYGKYVRLPAELDPSASAIGTAGPKAQSGWLIRYLYSDFKVELSTTGVAFQALPADTALDYFNIAGLRTYVETLLERCLSIRSERNELASKSAILALEVIEFLRKDFLFRKRVANGGLSLPYIEAVRSYESDRALATSSARALEATRDERTKLFSDEAKAETSLEAQRAAFMSATTAYVNDRAELKYAWPENSTVSTVFGHLQRSAKYMTERDLVVGQKRTEKEEMSYEGSASSYGHRAVASRERAEFILESAKIDLQQHNDAVQLTKAKLEAACTAGAALNYAAQEMLSQSRLSDMTRDLLAVVLALAQGLDVVYDNCPGIGPNVFALFPQGSHGSLSGDGGDLGDSLIEVAVWFQSVNHFLIAKSFAERRAQKTISLRTALGSEWAAFAGGSKKTLDIKEGMFPNEGCPKLLTVGALCIGPAAGDIVELSFELPRQGEFWAPSGRHRRFDQNGAKPLLLPRLPRQGETTSPPALRSDGVLGRSPLGTWAFELTASALTGTIDDIHVVFSVGLS